MSALKLLSSKGTAEKDGGVESVGGGVCGPVALTLEMKLRLIDFCRSRRETGH